MRIAACFVLLLQAATVCTAKRYDVRFEEHKVTSWDGETVLRVNSWTPIRENNESFPLIMFINSWGIPGFEYEAAVHRFARQGYIGVEYAARGWYDSTGVIGVAGANDTKDSAFLISWALEKWSGGVNPDKVGLGGISYGGGISLLAAGNDTRVTAVVAMSSWKSLVDALWWNFAPSLTWSNILMDLAKFGGRPPQVMFDVLSDVLAYKNVSFVESWGEQRSPERVLSALNARKVPIMMSNNFEDDLFHSNFQLDFWQQFAGPKRLLLNQGEHGEPDSAGLAPGNRHTYIWETAQAWFDRFLKSIDNGVDAPPLVRMEVSTDGIVKEHQKFDTWPPNNVGYTRLEYKLNPPERTGERFGSLTHSQERVAPHTTLAFSRETKMNCGIPVVSPTLTPFVPTRCKLDRIKVGHEVAFIASRAGRDFRFCGNAELRNLIVVANQPRFSLYAYLFAFEHGVRERDAVLLAHVPVGVWTNVTVGAEFLLPDLQFHTACANIPAEHHIALGLNIHNELYEDAGNSSSLAVNVTYSHGGPSLFIPRVEK